MDREELHSRIRRLVFASPALSEAFSRGEFRSVFKGRGVDFEALREYNDGDDARLIDWNVSVRIAKPYVRLYREDRSLTLFLLIDVSPSMEEGSGELSKRDMAVLAASLLAYAAQYRGMPVGALIFAGEPLRYFKPSRGKAHAMALIEAAVGLSAAAGPRAAGEAGGGMTVGRQAAVPGAASADGETDVDGAMTDAAARAKRGAGAVMAPARSAPARTHVPAPGSDLAGAFDTAGRLLKRRSLVMAASDFFASGYEAPMARLALRHDLVALRLTDALDRGLPASGTFTASDAEGGGRFLLPLGSRRFRREWSEFGRSEAERCRDACLSAQVPLLELGTDDDPARALLGFFGSRRHA